MPLPVHTTAAEQALSQGTTDDAEMLVLAKKKNIRIYIPATSTKKQEITFKNYKKVYKLY